MYLAKNVSRYLAIIAVALFSLITFNAQAQADYRGTKDDAVNMVNKAIEFYKQNGKDKAFAEFNNKSGQFTKGDLYVVVYDIKGKVLSHGANPKMIGRDVIELKDADGKQFVKERVEMMSKSANASGWQDYKFLNPVSRNIEQKSMYIKRHEDMIFGCGVYKN